MISPQDHHDRENLSALFDGELHGDAARFAHKRLAQDVRWRQSCGNWQLAGDVLRGSAMAPAPRTFAERVQRELARERREAEVAAASPGSRRGWMGGAALAASVAVAAWFVANPFDDAAPTATPHTPAVAAAAPPPVPASEPRLAPAAVASSGSTPGNQPAPMDRGEPVPGPRAPANAQVALASTPAKQPVPAPTGAAGSGMDVIAAAALVDPFRLPPAVASAPRPWPRAVLPGATGPTLTAGYGRTPQNVGLGAGAADAPGFYPFEPPLASEADAATFPEDQGDP